MGVFWVWGKRGDGTVGFIIWILTPGKNFDRIIFDQDRLGSFLLWALCILGLGYEKYGLNLLDQAFVIFRFFGTNRNQGPKL